jgi:CheY-like chemotaxis protein
MSDASAAQTILIVDDEPHIVHVLSVVLRQAGYRVMAASDGVDALDVIHRHNVDLVVTDLHLPRCGGAELAKRLYVEERTRRLPIIVLTGFTSDGDQGDLPNIRAVLTKPFSPRVVLEHVLRILPPRGSALASAA